MSAAAIDCPYIVEEVLGRGGMGVVYRAREAKTGKRVALKRAWATDQSKATKRRAQLEREFFTLAQLRHPRIIEVYDFGVDDEGPFYTMELLDGTDLDRAGQLPWREACRAICEIASSLAILHSRGLLHRDVSARNVRRTRAGHAKLIDFGTMSSIGLPGDAAGTPSFMSPEVVQMQALDARADLFSLGALAYYVLTGRHAYPAKRTSDLRDAWRSRPMPPQRLAPDIPAALSALVLQLLSLDRAARPQSAAEVINRLCAIAELPTEDLPQVTRAYLTTPTLVGRDPVLLEIRSRMLSLVRGQGGMLLIEGPEGSGRSRMLDACAFEAKLLGAQLVRAGASEDRDDAWGIAKRICSQLFALFPEQASASARLGRNVLACVIDELAPDEAVDSGTLSISTPERSVLLRELRDFVFAVCAGQRIVITIDDADRIDESSSALLAALADKLGPQSLLLVLSMDVEAGGPKTASERLLRRLGQRVELLPLEPEQTDVLVRSVFGDVPNVRVCAGAIHAIAHGNPGVTMELAQHLVDRGLARYEAGRWTLPNRIDGSELPESLTEALARRVDALSRDARELAELLAVGDDAGLSLESYRQLTEHSDSNRLFAALQELVSARVLVAGTAEPRFSQRTWLPVLFAGLPETRRQRLHMRIADLLRATGGEPIRRVAHLFEAGREREAVDLLCTLDISAQAVPLSMIERAIDEAERRPGMLDARALHRLRMTLLGRASLLLAADRFERCLPHVTRQLEHDTGSDIYAALSSSPPAERLATAMAQQQARYLATPPDEQVLGVGEALRELARLIGATASIAGSALDLSLFDRVPSLEPFLPLTPALRVVAETATATRDIVQGAHARARMHFEAVLARIEQPDRAGLEPAQHLRTRLGVHYALALIEASLGLNRAEERARILENDRAMRVSAWRIRSLLALNQADVEGAQKFSRRAEVLRLQDEQITQYIGTDAALELTAYERLDDLFGVKSALESIELLGHSFPGWAAFIPWARSSYAFFKGDLQSANEWIAPAVERLRAGVDLAYGGSAVHHVRVMRALGATPAAVAKAREYVAQFRQHELSLRLAFLELETSLLEAQAGESAASIARLTYVLAEREAEGLRGFPLGIFYETRARIAIWMGERDVFEEFAAKCAAEYELRPSTHLQTKYAALLDEAKQRELMSQLSARIPRSLSLPANAPSAGAESIRIRMLECVDKEDRARCALTLLLQSCDGYLGYLYGVEPSGIVPLAGLPDPKGDPQLEAWLRGRVQTEAARAEVATRTRDETAEIEGLITGEESATQDADMSFADLIFKAEDGQRYCATPLVAADGSKHALVAMLAVQMTGGQYPVPPLALCQQLAQILAESGDVYGIGVSE